MERTSLGERVTLLENELRGVPERVGALETQVTAVVVQVADFREEVRAELVAVHKEIKDGDDETRRLMRVLHEDLVERIASFGRG